MTNKSIFISILVFFTAMLIWSLNTNLKSNEIKLTPLEDLHWKYHNTVNEMDGDTTHYWEKYSENKHQFAFPYGNDRLKLVIRKSNVEKVIMLISKEASFYSDYYSGDYVKLKFDEEKPFKIQYSEASGGVSEVIFLNYNKLIDKIKSNDTLKTEVDFYKHNNVVYKFSLQGLNLK